MTDPTCLHQHVQRIESNPTMWTCLQCSTQFVPAYAVAGMVEQAASERIDMAAAVTAAMLWDFHQRAVEEYGPQMALKFPPPDEDGQYEHTPDTCPQHEFNAGQCIHCGASQFMGAEQ